MGGARAERAKVRLCGARLSAAAVFGGAGEGGWRRAAIGGRSNTGREPRASTDTGAPRGERAAAANRRLRSQERTADRKIPELGADR